MGFLSLQRHLFVLLVVLLGSQLSAEVYVRDASTMSDETLDWMKKVADWQLTQWSWDSSVSWERGALHAGMMACYEATKDEKYLESCRDWAEKFDWQLASSSHHADNMACGQTYVELYLLDEQDPNRYLDFKSKNDSMVADPTRFNCDISGGSETWWWCDALFMAPPGLVRLSRALDDPSYIDCMHLMWSDTQSCLYDTEENLFFRDINYLPPYNYNGEKVFWSRGNGWVIAGTARVLEYLPLDDPQRPGYLTLLQEMAAKLADIQLDDGYWHSDLLSPERYNNPETSGTGFFTFGIAWAVNNGLIDESQYWGNVEAGWDALRAAVHSDGKLGWVQPVGADPQTTTADDSDVFGVGAYLLAGSEIYKYNLEHDENTLDIFEKYLSDAELKGSWKDGSENVTSSTIKLGDYADNFMELAYNNDQLPYYSEVGYDFDSPKDFTADEAYYLSILVHGDPDNSPDGIYVKIKDSSSNVSVQVLADTSIVQEGKWVELAIPILDFAGVDLSSIEAIVIAVGEPGSQVSSGKGVIRIDNIRLVKRQCYPLTIDDIVLDCKVDMVDIAEIAHKWMLEYGESVEPVDPGVTNLVAHWAMDGNSLDVTGNGHDAQVGSEVVFEEGYADQAAYFSGNDYVSYLLCDNSSGLDFVDGLTISVWIRSYWLSDQWASVITKGLQSWRLMRNGSSSALSFHFNALGGGEYQANGSTNVLDGQWHHVMAIYDGSQIRLYIDGELDASAAAGSVNTSGDPVYIGSRVNNTANRNWIGNIDDVRLYDIALTEQNLLYLADNPGYMVIDQPESADLLMDGAINALDLEMLVQQWLLDNKWP